MLPYKGMYDFWKSRRVDANQIVKAHAQSTVARMNEVLSMTYLLKLSN